MTNDFLTITNDSVCFNKSGNPPISLREFPNLYKEFCNFTRNGTSWDPRDLEERGSEVLARVTNRETPSGIYCFACCVCVWGGVMRAWGQVHNKKNSVLHARRQIKNAVRKAERRLHKNEVQEAFDVFNESVDGFGDTATSKVLRMLVPDKAVAIDSILKRKLGISPETYGDWCAECCRLAKELQKKRYRHTVDPKRKWKAADVESVIYFHLSGKRYS